MFWVNVRRKRDAAADEISFILGDMVSFIWLISNSLISRSFLRMWWHSLTNTLMENFIFYAVFRSASKENIETNGVLTQILVR